MPHSSDHLGARPGPGPRLGSRGSEDPRAPCPVGRRQPGASRAAEGEVRSFAAASLPSLSAVRRARCQATRCRSGRPGRPRPSGGILPTSVRRRGRRGLLEKAVGTGAAPDAGPGDPSVTWAPAGPNLQVLYPPLLLAPPSPLLADPSPNIEGLGLLPWGSGHGVAPG